MKHTKKTPLTINHKGLNCFSVAFIQLAFISEASLCHGLKSSLTQNGSLATRKHRSLFIRTFSYRTAVKYFINHTHNKLKMSRYTHTHINAQRIRSDSMHEKEADMLDFYPANTVAKHLTVTHLWFRSYTRRYSKTQMNPNREGKATIDYQA